MKKVSVKDELTIKQNLAMGKSGKDSIKGTDVISPSTALSIKEREKDDIARIRAEYIKLLDKNGADNESRAKLWQEMTVAMKPDKRGKLHPDWTNREKALRYIDGLHGLTVDVARRGGRNAGNRTQVNVFSNVKKSDGKFTS